MKKGKVIKLDAECNLFMSDKPGKTIMLIGVNDLVIIEKDDRTLVVHKDRFEEAMDLWEAQYEEKPTHRDATD